MLARIELEALSVEPAGLQKSRAQNSCRLFRGHTFGRSLTAVMGEENAVLPNSLTGAKNGQSASGDEAPSLLDEVMTIFESRPDALVSLRIPRRRRFRRIAADHLAPVRLSSHPGLGVSRARRARIRRAPDEQYRAANGFGIRRSGR